MLVPALVLVVVALGALAVGGLARAHRLPRNRFVGIRTTWTMSRIDAFRRANRAAAPAFLAGGAVGAVAGVAAALAATTAAAVTLLIVGLVGLLGLVGVAGTTGARFAEADRAEVLAAESTPAGPCTLDAPATAPEADAGCGGSSAPCAGSCTVCPRASAPGTAGDVTSPRSPGRP